MKSRSLAAAASALLATSFASAQVSTAEAETLIPVSAGTPDAHFGGALAISGNVAAVASPGRTTTLGDNDGRVHVYRRTAPGAPWALEASLSPGFGYGNLAFGAAVALDGNRLLVGAPGLTAGADGTTFLYEYSTGAWTEVARFSEPSSHPQGGRFGTAVDLEGTVFVASDPSTGAVHVYGRTGSVWARTATIVSTVTGEFGADVSLYQERIAIGVVRRGLPSGGTVRIYRRTGTTWDFEASVFPDSVPYGRYIEDDFGSSVDLVNQTLLVGAPQDRNPASASTIDRGAAFVFRRSGTSWSQYSRIDRLNPVAGARFGSDVALAGELIATIGADGATAAGSLTQGAVHAYQLNGGLWLHRHELLGSEALTGDRLGAEVAADSRGGDWTVLAGADLAGSNDVGAAYSFEVTQGTAEETQRLTEPDKTSSGSGAAAAVSGSVAVFGAPREDALSGADLGAAYVYERTGSLWTFARRLSLLGLEPGDQFGFDVATDGTTIVVGCPYDDRFGLTDCGAAHVFVRNTSAWVLEGTLTAADAASGDLFGTTVAVRGDWVIIGALGDNNAAGTDAGAAYVFQRSNGSWSAAGKLASTDLAAGDRFGSSVALLSSTRVCVGAPDSDAVATNGGAAYVFDRTPIIGGFAWLQRTRLTPPGLAANDAFGAEVAVSGNYLAIGAPLTDLPSATNCGAIHVFQATSTLPGQPANTFVHRSRLTEPTPASDRRLGAAVAMEGGIVVGGSPRANHLGLASSGWVNVFQQQTSVLWTHVDTAVVADARAGDRFGASVALSGSWILAGADGDTNLAGIAAGAGHAFDLWASASFGEAYCTATPNMTGQPGLMSALGSPLLANNDLRLRATQLPQNSAGFFLASRTPGLVSHPGGSYGDLCLGGAIGRFVGAGQVLNSGTSGTIELPVNLFGLPQPGGAVVAQYGQTWRFQAWYRDFGATGPGSNFTNGLAVVLH